MILAVIKRSTYTVLVVTAMVTMCLMWSNQPDQDLDRRTSHGTDQGDADVIVHFTEDDRKQENIIATEENEGVTPIYDKDAAEGTDSLVTAQVSVGTSSQSDLKSTSDEYSTTAIETASNAPTDQFPTTTSPRKVPLSASGSNQAPGEDCPQLKPPPRARENWHVMEANASWVATAHRDPRENDRTVVKVMGMMLTSQLFNQSGTVVYCQLWNPRTGTVEVSTAVARGINQRVRYLYENLILTCEFSKEAYVYNQSVVSVVTERCTQPTYALPIHDNQKIGIPIWNYTVCVCGSLRNNYSDYQRFVEWMELNSILGVDRTITYDTDTPSYMKDIFHYYTSKGTLEAIPWTPPYVFVRKYAHLAMVHDCLMRAMSKTKYVAFIDVDETIAPRQPDAYTWDDMIRSAKCQGRSYISASNSLFHPDWDSDERFAHDTKVASDWRLYSLLKTKRETQFMEFEERSKNLVRPEMVEHIKLHKVFLREGVEEEPCVLDPGVGALHHYRWLYSSNQRGSPDEPGWVEDRSLHKYSDQLIARVRKTYRDLGDVIPTGS